MLLAIRGAIDLISLLLSDISVILNGRVESLNILFFNIFNFTVNCPELKPLLVNIFSGSTKILLPTVLFSSLKPVSVKS